MHLNSSAPFITCLLYHSQSKVGTRAGSIIYTVRYLTYCIICSTAQLVSTSSTSSAQTTPLRTRSYKNASPPPPPPAAAAAFQTGRPFPDAYGRRWESLKHGAVTVTVASTKRPPQKRGPRTTACTTGAGVGPVQGRKRLGLGGRRAARLNHSSSARLAGLGLPAAELPSCGWPPPCFFARQKRPPGWRRGPCWWPGRGKRERGARG